MRGSGVEMIPTTNNYSIYKRPAGLNNSRWVTGIRLRLTAAIRPSSTDLSPLFVFELGMSGDRATAAQLDGYFPFRARSLQSRHRSMPPAMETQVLTVVI